MMRRKKKEKTDSREKKQDHFIGTLSVVLETDRGSLPLALDAAFTACAEASTGDWSWIPRCPESDIHG